MEKVEHKRHHSLTKQNNFLLPLKLKNNRRRRISSNKLVPEVH
jgi:hypothetical protein